jgi:DMSO/TMAO reductase YedYZ molybdopterin-dependent catalytic subunit
VTQPWDDGTNRESDPASLGAPGRGHVFVRSHFPQPVLDQASHVVAIGGAVRQATRVTVAELEDMAHQDVVVAMECAGNGRGLAGTVIPGVQWTGGAVGRARWTGVPLRALLELAEPLPGARRVLLKGADGGPMPDGSTGRFERGLPLRTALDGDVLVATAMDGAPIPPEHGGPVRVVVPGWYGVASIKWLAEIEVLDEDRGSHWETVDYAIEEPDPRNGRVRRVPLTEMQPKAQVTAPPRDAAVPHGPVTVEGLAWAGRSPVAQVHVSDDGGATWDLATLVADPQPYDWVGWRYVWQPRTAGRHELRVRCTDAAGATQPIERDPGRGAYLFNEVAAHPVVVADAAGVSDAAAQAVER